MRATRGRFERTADPVSCGGGNRLRSNRAKRYNVTHCTHMLALRCRAGRRHDALRAYAGVCGARVGGPGPLTHSNVLLDSCHVTLYNLGMIKSFADKHTELLFLNGSSKRLPPEIRARAIRKLDRIDTAISVNDLILPPGNRLLDLDIDRKGQWSIAINDQWRICFRFEAENAFDVEVCDYH